MIFRRFPYTTLNDINLDWIIKQVKQIAAALQGKQDKPDAAGAAGQVLGLDENLDPVWIDQSGGGGTNNYNNLTNKPQINSVTLSGNKTAADLGLANASDIPTVPVQSVNGQTGAVELDAADVGALPSNTFIPGYSIQLPVMDGEASAGTTYARYSMEGHRHPTDTSRASNTDIGIVQNTDNATRDISKGMYVIWKGALYITSSAIAKNAPLSSSNLNSISDGGFNQFLARSMQGEIAKSSSKTISLESNSNGIVIFPSANDAYKDIAIFRCAYEGDVYIKLMFGTTIGLSTGSNELTITNPSTASVLTYFIMYW